MLGPSPGHSDSAGLGWALRICFSNKSQVKLTDAVGLGNHTALGIYGEMYRTENRTSFWGMCSKREIPPCFSVQKRTLEGTISSRDIVPKCQFR